MEDFIKMADRRNPVEVHINFEAPDINFLRPTFTPGITRVNMLFRIPGDAGQVEAVALMYYQFDKFMKEKYGAQIEQYMAWKRSRRIEGGTDIPEQEAVNPDA